MDAAAVERISSFCDRSPKLCAEGAELWAAFVKKAEFGARHDLRVRNAFSPGYLRVGLADGSDKSLLVFDRQGFVGLRKSVDPGAHHILDRSDAAGGHLRLDKAGNVFGQIGGG